MCKFIVHLLYIYVYCIYIDIVHFIYRIYNLRVMYYFWILSSIYIKIVFQFNMHLKNMYGHYISNDYYKKK